jgi:hypothetical protein
MRPGLLDSLIGLLLVAVLASLSAWYYQGLDEADAKQRLEARNRRDVAVLGAVRFCNEYARGEGSPRRYFYGKPTLLRDLPPLIAIEDMRILGSP